jgi:hypothetical protein
MRVKQKGQVYENCKQICSLESRRLLGRPKCRLRNNIQIYFEKFSCGIYSAVSECWVSNRNYMWITLQYSRFSGRWLWTTFWRHCTCTVHNLSVNSTRCRWLTESAKFHAIRQLTRSDNWNGPVKVLTVSYKKNVSFFQFKATIFCRTGYIKKRYPKENRKQWTLFLFFVSVLYS